MPTPENLDDLHRFIGMMTYLSQFIPHFAEKAYTTRALEERRAVAVGRRSPEEFRRTETCRIYKRMLTVL